MQLQRRRWSGTRPRRGEQASSRTERGRLQMLSTTYEPKHAMRIHITRFQIVTAAIYDE